MASFIAKQMMGNQLGAVKGTVCLDLLSHNLSRYTCNVKHGVRSRVFVVKQLFSL